MRKFQILVVIGAMACGGAVFADKGETKGAAQPSQTTDTVRPVQLALVPGVQLVPEDESIQGFRFNILYGRNHNVSGVDIGVVHETMGNFTGIGFGVLSFVRGEGRGLQFDGVYTEVAGSMTGLQVGIANRAGTMHGIQLGLVNFADDMTGIQLGLWNEIKNKEMWNVFPIFNAAF